MDKIGLVSHLANLITIMDYHEMLGTTKNAALVTEFKTGHAKLVELLEKEQKK